MIITRICIALLTPVWETPGDWGQGVWRRWHFGWEGRSTTEMFYHWATSPPQSYHATIQLTEVAGRDNLTQFPCSLEPSWLALLFDYEDTPSPSNVFSWFTGDLLRKGEGLAAERRMILGYNTPVHCHPLPAQHVSFDLKSPSDIHITTQDSFCMMLCWCVYHWFEMICQCPDVYSISNSEARYI